MFKLYNDDGFVNMRGILEIGVPFLFILGARGVGKTYPALKIAIQDKLQFIYMRRTQTQIDEIKVPEYSPFKSLNRDCGFNIQPKNITTNNFGFYDDNAEHKLVGYGCALSTIANIRGFDASDVELLIYDEFVKEKHEKPIKSEGWAFRNAYETINRNRELTGRKPLTALVMGNSNDLANDIFVELQLVRMAEKMKKNNQEVYINKERGMAMIFVNKSPISEKKKNTALYRLTPANDSFNRMAIGNEFSNDEIGRIKSRKLVEFKPLVSIGEVYIYQHKSEHSLYVSLFDCGSFPVRFGVGDAEKARFFRQYSWIWDAYMENNIEFEEYLCEILLTKVFK